MKEILGQEWLDQRIKMVGGILDPATGVPKGMGACELHLANSGSPESIRATCRRQTQEWAAKVAEMKFPVKKHRVEGGMQVSRAKYIAEALGGTWWKADQYYAGLEYERIDQPERRVMNRVWMAAAVAGDPELAKQVAAPYPVPLPLKKTDSLDTIRENCLRHALAQDDDAFARQCEALEAGYVADFPPDLIEFPLGVFEKDAAKVLEGLRKLNTRYNGKWNEKKWRAWFDKPGYRKPKSWEECLKATKDALFNCGYFINWWALAWLNVASWRGMDAVFENPKKFSQWIPLELARSKPA